MMKDAATRMAEGLPAAWETIVRTVDGGVVHRERDLVLTLTNLPTPELNTAFVERPPRNPSASLEAAAGVFSENGQRLGIDLPRDRYPDVERAAEEFGMRVTVSRPGMTSPVSAIDPAVAPDGVELLRIKDEAHLEEFWEIQAAVFGMEPDVVRAYVGPGALASDDVDLHLARADGVPIASSVGIVDRGTVGIFGVATLPEARGRGIGTAVTAAAVDSARPRADLAYLQASEEGERAYRRMGFREASVWDVWILPA